MSDPSHVLPDIVNEVRPDLTFEPVPVDILDRQENKLRNKVVPMVKILWRSSTVEEETWETESSMRERHPSLFV